MLNKSILIGRLTKSPELRYTPSGVAVANFTLAIDRNFKNAQGERETDFIPCVAYRQLAEFVANYLDKGKMAAVDGRIQIRTYTAQDGQKRWVTEIIAENVHLLSPKSEGTGAQQGQAQPAQGYSQNQQGYQQNTSGYPQSPPGSMPPPPSYQGQPPAHPTGSMPTSQLGHEVNLDDEIPF